MRGSPATLRWIISSWNLWSLKCKHISCGIKVNLIQLLWIPELDGTKHGSRLKETFVEGKRHRKIIKESMLVSQVGLQRIREQLAV